MSGGKDIRIQGGANCIQQYLNAGMIEECTIHVSPVLIGSGLRLFENIDKRKVSFEIIKAIHSPLATHIRYKVKNK